ncbi:hypothetical protein [Paenibacillus hexagrammi]|uniref:Uncharacterized protein n=1 Tax=Paenibacillus hexagrammi TaxID=2908839 RepID=A0ABY3SE60_9BACL|nr:hypothetical protein [Paenibacillus sp. YPD9-1]UJF31509.1 hypothetical protein L0M14_16975 [Paenibacillus sp. YPD9-1]
MKLSVKLVIGIVALIALAGVITGAMALKSIQDSNKITNIELVDGQSVYGIPGAQMIVRMGKTIAVSTDNEGIPDLTAGKDLLPGTSVADNHLLFFPKDTRGLKADPNTDNEIWITVRGGFTAYDSNGKKIAPISE